MSNHVHLLVSPYLENSIGKMMQTLGRYYVQFFNHRYKCTGTIWEGRYRAAYPQLLRARIPEKILEAIREATYKA